MQASELLRAVAATKAIAASVDLVVDDTVVLQDSDKLTLRLLPCDFLARVAPVDKQGLQFEIDIARPLAESGSPVATLARPEVYERDGFVVTFWTYYEPVPDHVISPAEYADALGRLHAGMSKLEVPTPHFLDRVGEAQALVADRNRTPELPDAEREFLDTTLRTMRQAIVERGAPDQLLHGEPHAGNLLDTEAGPLFIDFETCCRGPVEFDVAHAPEEVGNHYPGIDKDLLRDCRILSLAIVVMWRWDSEDQFPNGRQQAAELLAEVRTLLNHRPNPQ
jgi:Ser/Thr protein kinase RdoA (MazF antagonist)